MRKSLLVLLLVCSLALTGCKNDESEIPKGLDEENYKIATVLLDTLQTYYDGEISTDEAKARVDSLTSQYDKSKDDENTYVGGIMGMVVFNIDIIFTLGEPDIVRVKDTIDDLKELLDK